jgi:trehalose 6-phosphate phosphatase
MEHILSAQALQTLRTHMRQGPLLAFDFDGTLAPIVAHPADASIPSSSLSTLKQLSERNPVAILTGRSIRDAQSRLGFEPRCIVGQHGAESLIEGEYRVVGASRELASLREKIAGHADELRAAGVSIEDKQQSFALHYRQAADHQRARQSIDRLLHGMPAQLQQSAGKCVVNIVAGDSPNKAGALATLVTHLQASAVIFLGDDENDEPVFRYAKTCSNYLSIKVGADEASSAQYYLRDDSEVQTLLMHMLQALAPRS